MKHRIDPEGRPLPIISAEDVKKHARADGVARERYAYREHPEPHYLTYGPKTRREFLNLLRWNGGSRP